MRIYAQTALMAASFIRRKPNTEKCAAFRSELGLMRKVPEAAVASRTPKNTECFEVAWLNAKKLWEVLVRKPNTEKCGAFRSGRGLNR